MSSRIDITPVDTPRDNSSHWFDRCGPVTDQGSIRVLLDEETWPKCRPGSWVECYGGTWMVVDCNTDSSVGLERKEA